VAFATWAYPLLHVLIGRITDFLSNFVGPTSGDVTDGIADMDIGDEDSDPESQRMKGLKYMSQLVRVNYVSFLSSPSHVGRSNASRTATNK
jgi:hypothetical protein